jgi:alanine dehydrogenase
VETLIIRQTDVRDLLSMDTCIAAVRDALADTAKGEGLQPLRAVMWLPERVGAIGTMPGFISAGGLLGIKTISVFPGNEGTEFDSHQGTVMLFDSSNGALLAIVDATELTAIRTAAASGVATDALARPDSSVVAILGSGTQAATHIDAMCAVRPIREVRIWSRDPSNAERLVAAKQDSASHVRATATVAEAVAGADIVCTTTASRSPVLIGQLLEPGMHINAVGACVPSARELDGEAVTRCQMIVDSRASALAESGDFLLAKAEGLVDDRDIVAELGEVLIGAAVGRKEASQITLFNSLGLAVEDVAAAHSVYRSALKAGVGTSIELGGARRG